MAAPLSDHDEIVRREFTKQAQAYAASALIVNNDRLERLIQLVKPHAGARVLDVATGPGYVAMAFAAHGCDVIGLDLTEAPLAIAEKTRQERGLTNLRFMTGNAEQLPFDAQSFDIVVSRYALHHFVAQERMLSEMARVCREQGTVVIEDLVVSEHPVRAAYQNRLEQLRDPSHTQALSIRELLLLFTTCGLDVEHVAAEVLTQSVEKWLANAHTPDERAEEVRALIAQDEREDLSGCRPFHCDETVYFRQCTATLLSRKLAAISLQGSM
jgi:ubiquinone/menaquinone biosynthesis C-methylase UbiE